ncbi:MAG: orotidine-5'-phosphate decarboxylase [Comamonadaceae bacterium]|nr:orotidine-5'-phosphate decarboxylase [Comamonadaceae bacterium]
MSYARVSPAPRSRKAAERAAYNARMTTFTDKLRAALAQRRYAAVRRPRPRPRPASRRTCASATTRIFAFCARDRRRHRRPGACAFKPQIAYFASARAEDQLEAPDRAHAHARTRRCRSILDAKRGDIGATAEQYAREAFERYGADAVTLSPFMGFDSIEPYLAYADRGAFLLCRTSNPGGDDLQMLDVGGEQLYERVARLAAARMEPQRPARPGGRRHLPGRTGARARARRPTLPLLVPGIGAQGGDVQASVQRRRDRATAPGMLINSSRAILYAGTRRGLRAGRARPPRSARATRSTATAPADPPA